MMSCRKCCFNPCDNTSLCSEGTYYVEKEGTITKIVAVINPVKTVIVKAVETALEIKQQQDAVQ